MERLEAAMAKARAARGTAPAERGPAPGGLMPRPAPAAPAAPAGGDWAALPAVEITPRLARRKRLNALLGPELATHYDILRSRVLRQMREAGWTRLAVTSPTTKCGKSTISLNLALSLARHSDLKIVLMDFDLRHPSQAGLLGLKTCPDIAGLLRPGARFADYALRYGGNLAICANRAKVRNSAELLQSRDTEAALDRIEAEWRPDLMIFDTPPMQGNDDNLGFFARTDCALIIAAAGSSTLAQIDRCEQEVGHLTNILGTVLNKCRYADNNTGYDQSYY
jgi:Mrp family chromosome partitioning ATPase